MCGRLDRFGLFMLPLLISLGDEVDTEEGPWWSRELAKFRRTRFIDDTWGRMREEKRRFD